LFVWTVGAEVVVNTDGICIVYLVTGRAMKVHAARHLIKMDYAEWVEDEKRDWGKFIDEKKTEFWTEFGWCYSTDGATMLSSIHAKRVIVGIYEVSKWQLRMMYLYVLIEYARLVNGDWEPSCLDDYWMIRVGYSTELGLPIEYYAEKPDGYDQYRGIWEIKFKEEETVEKAIEDMRPILDELHKLDIEDTQK